MAAVENSEPSSPPLELTVLEYEAGTVHVRLKERIDASLVQPGSLADHLAANSGTSGRVCLYYVVPVPVPFGTVMPIDDAVSAAVFFEWFRRNVTDVFAVVVNDATSDFEKVVQSYVHETPVVDLEQIDRFERTVAKPFSHRPIEPELDSSNDSHRQLQRRQVSSIVHSSAIVAPLLRSSSGRAPKQRISHNSAKNKRSKK